MSEQTIDARCIVEVQELHRFFQVWFAGEVADTDEEFGRFSQTIADTFTIVGPDGGVTDCATIKQALRNAHSAGPFEIWIENPQVRALGDGVMLVLYEEWQIRESNKTARQSSALFRPKPQAPNGVEWLHVHETWIGSGQ